MISTKRAKELLISGAPVMRDSDEYKKINALVFRMNNGLVDPYAELQDARSNNSVVICPLTWLEEIKGHKTKKNKEISDDTILVMYDKIKEQVGELSSYIYRKKYNDAQSKINNILRSLMKMESAMGVFDIDEG